MLQQRSSDRARFGWIGGILILIIAALFVPMGQGRLEAEPEPTPIVNAPALPEGIADLFMYSKSGLLEKFGEPMAIFYGDNRYTLDSLPDQYYLAYEDISFYIRENEVLGITLLDGKYVFGNGMSVGDTEDTIIAALGTNFNRREFDNKDFLEYEDLHLMIEIYKPERIAREINIGREVLDSSGHGGVERDPEFARLLAQRVDDLDIDHTDRKGVVAIFGEPIKYVWYNKEYTPDKLPRLYIMDYPEGFRIFMAEDLIVEIRFEQGSPYVYQGTIRVGTPLESVLAIMGAPDKTVIGDENEFSENVLFKDISGRKGHCYYHLPDKHVRFWFSDYKVAAIYMTRSDYHDGPRHKTTDPEFANLLTERVAQLDIDKADLAEVKRIFGEPKSYLWGNETFQADELPDRFIAQYPNGFQIFMANDSIHEIRFEGGGSNYVFKEGIQVGSTIDEVISVIGEPEKIVEGKSNRFEEGVLYKDISGRTGHCYYHRPDHNVRLWFMNYKVIAIYITRSDYGGGRKAEPWDEAFGSQLAKRVAQLDIDQANRATVETLFGKPQRYHWMNKGIPEQELKENYILDYPCDFSVWMKDDKIMEIRFRSGSRYAYAPGVSIGASVEDVVAVLGEPVETLIGQENGFKDKVLYRDISGQNGFCYYHRVDKQIRVWFQDDEVIAIFMTRSDFSAG